VCDNSVPSVTSAAEQIRCERWDSRKTFSFLNNLMIRAYSMVESTVSIVMLINLNTWNFSSIQEIFILGIINSGCTLHAFEERPLFISSISTEDIISIEDTVLVLQKIAACFVQILIKFCVYTDINKIQSRHYFKRF